MWLGRNDYPNPYLFADGSMVRAPQDWTRRAGELRNMYRDLMYGYYRSGEQVSFEIAETGAQIISFFGTFDAVGAKKLTIRLSLKPDDAAAGGDTSAGGDILQTEEGQRATEFAVSVFLPDEKECSMPEDGWPYIVCMHDIPAREYAVKHGFAVIVINSGEIASDNTEHKGCFYDLYPYGEAADTQTGVLAAWGWGASKVLDAMYAGAAEQLGINPDNSIVTGVSRWGKATAVCGAFENRFKMVVPSCSGAGGLALYRYVSEGKTYDFSSKGAPADYTYGKNEPLGSLQAPGERGWFNDAFMQFTAPEEIPLEQYELAALAAEPGRYYFIIGSCINEDWVNAPAMWQCFKAAEQIYGDLGLEENIVCNFHKEGHAVIDEDMAFIIDYFNLMVYGIEPEEDLFKITTSVFEEKANRDFLFG